MFKSYFKTAFRFLLKNKTFSFINIIGLATGTLCCLYILLYVQDQYSYDKQHKNVNDVYRVTTTLQLPGDNHKNSTCSPPIVPAMKHDFAEIEQYTRAVPAENFGAPKTLLTYKEKSFYEKDLVYVDSTFFDIFNYHFANGTPVKCLNEPYTVVLVKAVAIKLFGNEDPVGKVITLNNGFGRHDFKVNGVIDESLGKTNIKGSIFIAMNSGGMGDYTMKDQDWGGNNFTYSFIRLRPGASAALLESKLPSFLNKYGAQQMKAIGMTKQLHLQPVRGIHTTSDYEVEMSKTVSPSFLNILLLIAILIQVIACINFMNLSTARASKRAKEVGVRKVIGAGKFDLIKQFLGESFLLAFIGVIIALPLLWLLLPYLNQLTQSDIQLSIFTDYRLWLMLMVLILITGFVAGSYPAFYLSAFKAVKVIKGNFSNQVSAAGIRRSLVVFQFVLSIVLITGIIIIYSQLSYIKNKDLGFDKNQKLVFSFYTSDTQKQLDAYANDLRQLAEVKVVSKSDNYLSQFVPHDHGVYPAGGNMTTAIDAQNIITDENVLKANGIKLISGRNFRLNDTGKVLINETLAKRLGLTLDKAPGTRLYTQYGNNPLTFVEVAGVMKDFNYNSLHADIKAFMFVYDNNPGSFNDLVVSVNSKNYKELLSKIEAIWHKDMPSTPFEYLFLDQEVQKQYEAEITMSQIINSFTLMAILISCLGLFGLAAFSAEQRNKEIGIRKVLGASVSGIVQLLSKDFLQLVLISFVIATPIAWYAMNKWLQAFAYRISLSWWMFALAGVIAVFIALFTVSFQAIKAALSNPIKSLKTE
ncbi:putative ABC transport system permease protein [Mucilaginibacter mallensis]|uniref:Putative ABC transport system permease protein n=1 Tax=Mucilaginibacter mallensis TaxID=652787 RepID=A0A1H1QM79_MUCMA|nr:ABC transporter permease [Mucilaginibacter mallensis]SDS24486.1 putative ABC transport system permease protein [Mucilaginibacter mallensis]